MKGYIFTLLAVFVLAFSGCSNSQTNKGKSEEGRKEYVLKIMLDSCLNNNPNATNNDITKSILADSIKATIQNYIGDTLPFLTDIPVEYEMCLEYPKSSFDFESESFKNAGKYVVKFSFGKYSSKCELSDNYETTFQIFTIMDKVTVSKLIDKELYYVNGKFIDFANNTKETGFVLPSGKCLIDYPRVLAGYGTYDKKIKIDLGTLVLEDVSFSQINQ